MFDLEESIHEWRARLNAGSRQALDELESHLRDDIEEQVTKGTSPGAAFEKAAANLGGPESLNAEFDKIARGSLRRRRMGQGLLILAGIPNPELQLNMDNSISKHNPEPRWATYTRAAAFAAPSILLWTFAVIWLLPKLQQVCTQAGIVMPSIFRVMAFIPDHLSFIVAGVMVVLGLLESRSNRWPRYRRTSLGGAVVIINTMVHVLTMLMVVLALLAAPALMHQNR